MTATKKLQNGLKPFVTEEEEEENEDERESSGAEEDESAEDLEETNLSNNGKGNAHWADAMSKILKTNKPKRKKTIVLSKAKKLNETLSKPKEEDVPFEIEGAEGKVKKELKKKIVDNEESEITSQPKKRKKKDLLGIKIDPTQMNLQYEKNLKRIATEGVVRVFKAAEEFQKQVNDKLVQAGPLERKREKALKSIDRKAFLDVLMGGTNKLIPEDDSEIKEENDEDDADASNKKDNKTWNVLKDSYMMGSNLKDWDKHNSNDEDSSDPEEMDSD